MGSNLLEDLTQEEVRRRERVVAIDDPNLVDWINKVANARISSVPARSAIRRGESRPKREAPGWRYSLR